MDGWIELARERARERESERESITFIFIQHPLFHWTLFYMPLTHTQTCEYKPMKRYNTKQVCSIEIVIKKITAGNSIVCVYVYMCNDTVWWNRAMIMYALQSEHRNRADIDSICVPNVLYKNTTALGNVKQPCASEITTTSRTCSLLGYQFCNVHDFYYTGIEILPHIGQLFYWYRNTQMLKFCSK